MVRECPAGSMEGCRFLPQLMSRSKTAPLCLGKPATDECMVHSVTRVGEKTGTHDRRRAAATLRWTVCACILSLFKFVLMRWLLIRGVGLSVCTLYMFHVEVHAAALVRP